VNTSIAILKRTASWTWQRISTGAVVVMIVAAFTLGFWARGGDSQQPPGHATTRPATSQAAGRQMYTCSMHPQVRLPDADTKCPICFMSLIPVTADDGGAGGERRLVLTDAAIKLARVDTTRVARFFPTADVRLFGKITYDQTRVARITSYFAGRLDRLFVDYVGVPVREGDHLAEIYSPELLAAFEELRLTRLAVDQSNTQSELVRSTSRMTVQAARDKLRLLGLTPQQVQAAESGEMTGDRFTVYSPIGGVVTHLAALAGDYVKTGTPIATVADLSRLWLDLEAYESQLPLLRWGQRVTFTVASHPGEVFGGVISFIAPVVDDRTRTAAVRVTIDNSDGRLKPGMFATAEARVQLAAGGRVVSNALEGKWVGPMHPEVVQDGPGTCDVCGMDLVRAEDLGVAGDPTPYEEPLVVPKTAVLVTGKRAVVYLLVPDTEKPTFEGREIVLGPRAGDLYIVRAGLSEGDEVVTNGVFKIDSAMQIAAKPSMMMPTAGDGDGDGDAGVHDAVPGHFIAGLDLVYAAYLAAQKALALDDLGGFIVATRDLRRSIDLVDTGGLVGAPLGAWRQAALQLTVDPTPANIAVARSVFERMSHAAIDLEKQFGHDGAQTWHLAFCPMAFDNAGAVWLQRDDVIHNPYFGASMLRCGTIRAALPPMGQRGQP
jgi:Cu(I)/Ag(I) efflux system membrane fusion protein